MMELKPVNLKEIEAVCIQFCRQAEPDCLQPARSVWLGRFEELCRQTLYPGNFWGVPEELRPLVSRLVLKARYLKRRTIERGDKGKFLSQTDACRRMKKPAVKFLQALTRWEIENGEL